MRISWYPDSAVLKTTSPAATPPVGSAPIASPSNVVPSASTRSASCRLALRFHPSALALSSCASRWSHRVAAPSTTTGDPRRIVCRTRPEAAPGIGRVASPAREPLRVDHPTLLGIEHAQVRRRSWSQRCTVVGEQPDLEVRELGGAQPLRLLGRGLRLELPRPSTSGTDDVCLAPLAQPLADELVGAGPLLLPHDPGLHRLAVPPAAREGPSRRGRRRRSARGCAGSASRSCEARAGPLRRAPWPSSAARCSTPKRCCSSTTQTASRRKATSGSISAWVPTDHAELAARRAGPVPPGAAPPASRWSTGRTEAGGRASSRSRVAACCSARVSVGAISAAW